MPIQINWPQGFENQNQKRDAIVAANKKRIGESVSNVFPNSLLDEIQRKLRLGLYKVGETYLRLLAIKETGHFIGQQMETIEPVEDQCAVVIPSKYLARFSHEMEVVNG